MAVVAAAAAARSGVGRLRPAQIDNLHWAAGKTAPQTKLWHSHPREKPHRDTMIARKCDYRRATQATRLGRHQAVRPFNTMDDVVELISVWGAAHSQPQESCYGLTKPPSIVASAILPNPAAANSRNT